MRDLLNVLSAHWTRARNAPISYIYPLARDRSRAVIFLFLFIFLILLCRSLIARLRAVNVLNGTKIISRRATADEKLLFHEILIRHFSFPFDSANIARRINGEKNITRIIKFRENQVDRENELFEQTPLIV